MYKYEPEPEVLSPEGPVPVEPVDPVFTTQSIPSLLS